MDPVDPQEPEDSEDPPGLREVGPVGHHEPRQVPVSREVDQWGGEGLPEQVLQVLGVLGLHPGREPGDPGLHGEQVGVGASAAEGRSKGSLLAGAESAWTNQDTPAAVGVELQGELGRNQEQEVRLDVRHRPLHQSLFWKRPPGGGVNAEGGVYGSAALLLGQTFQEAPDLGAKEGPGSAPEPEPGPAGYSQRGVLAAVDAGDVHAGEEVSVHAVDARHVVEAPRVLEQPPGLVRQEVPVHHRGQFQQVHDHT